MSAAPCLCDNTPTLENLTFICPSFYFSLIIWYNFDKPLLLLGMECTEQFGNVMLNIVNLSQRSNYSWHWQIFDVVENLKTETTPTGSEVKRTHNGNTVSEWAQTLGYCDIHKYRLGRMKRIIAWNAQVMFMNVEPLSVLHILYLPEQLYWCLSWSI